jgi:hypothetical protein
MSILINSPNYDPNKPCFIHTLTEDALSVFFKNFVSTTELGQLSQVCTRWKNVISPILRVRQAQRRIKKSINHTDPKYFRTMMQIDQFCTPVLIRYTVGHIAKKLSKDGVSTVKKIFKKTQMFIQRAPFDDLKTISAYLRPSFTNPDPRIRRKALEVLRTITKRSDFLCTSDRRYSNSAFLEECCQDLVSLVQKEGSYDKSDCTIRSWALEEIGTMGAGEKISNSLRNRCFEELVSLSQRYPMALKVLGVMGASQYLSTELRQGVSDQFVLSTGKSGDLGYLIQGIGIEALSTTIPKEFKERSCVALIALTRRKEWSNRFHAVQELRKVGVQFAEMNKECCEALVRLCQTDTNNVVLEEAMLGLVSIGKLLDSNLIEKCYQTLSGLAQDKMKDPYVRLEATKCLTDLVNNAKILLSLRGYCASVFLSFSEDLSLSAEKDILEGIAKLAGVLVGFKDLPMQTRKKCCLVLLSLLSHQEKKIRRESISSLGIIRNDKNLFTEVWEPCYKAWLGALSFKERDLLAKAIGGVCRFGDPSPEFIKNGYRSLSKAQLTDLASVKDLPLSIRTKSDEGLIHFSMPLYIPDSFDYLGSLEWISVGLCLQLWTALVHQLQVSCNIVFYSSRIIDSLVAIISSHDIPEEIRQNCLESLIKTIQEHTQEDVFADHVCLLRQIAITDSIPLKFFRLCLDAVIHVVQNEASSDVLIGAASSLLAMGNAHESLSIQECFNVLVVLAKNSRKKSLVRSKAVEMIGELSIKVGANASIRESCDEILCELSQDPDKLVRQGVVKSLGLVAGSICWAKENCYKTLLKLAKDEEKEIRSFVVSHLSSILIQPQPKTLKKQCFEALLNLSLDTEESVLCEVVQTISNLGILPVNSYEFPKEFYLILIRLSQSKYNDVRQKVAQSLCYLARCRIIPDYLRNEFLHAMQKLSEDQDRYVLKALASNLGLIGFAKHDPSILCEGLHQLCFDILTKFFFDKEFFGIDDERHIKPAELLIRIGPPQGGV